MFFVLSTSAWRSRTGDTFHAIFRVLHDLEAKLVFDILSALSSRLELDLLGIVRRVFQKGASGRPNWKPARPFESTASTVEVEANWNHQQKPRGQHIKNQSLKRTRLLKAWRDQKQMTHNDMSPEFSGRVSILPTWPPENRRSLPDYV